LSLLERGELNEEKLANEFINCPEKKIVEKYISEASRVLKPNCLFRSFSCISFFNYLGLLKNKNID
jgi:hypothetical protein